MKRILSAALISLALAAPGAAQYTGYDISGAAYVVDGDTLHIGATKIRMFGIDAPEHNQSCTKATGETYSCGDTSTNALREIIGNSPVQCKIRDTDRYGRSVSQCRVRNIDLGEYMVRNGFAVAYRRYASDYIGAEQEAKNNRRGIWSGAFENPADFRHSGRKSRDPFNFF